MKLFPKLSLVVSVLLLATIASLSVSYYWSELRQMRQELRAEEEGVLQNLVHMAEESFVANDDLLLVKYTGLLPRWNSAIVSADFVGPTGQIVAHSEPERIGHASLAEEPRVAVVMVLRQPVRVGSHAIGTAEVTFSQQRLDERLEAQLGQLRRRLAAVSFGALFLGLVGSFLIAGSWTRPIKNLAAAAERIGQGKWQLALGAMEYRRDELGFLTKSFSRMADQLQELDQMKEDFVAAVTHELRSPLGAVESYLNLIEQGPNGEKPVLPPEVREYMQRMRLNTQRLTKFVNDLLDVAALERGKMRIERQPVDMVWVAKDVITLFEAKARERQLSMELSAAGDLPNAWADTEKMRQVIINLVSNAIKFTPERGHVQLKIDHLSPKQLLRVSVSDTGIGIEPADAAKIFNKFEQVQSARLNVKGPKGTGLGLSITRELIHLQGGELGLESAPGKGSTFFFTVPVVRTGTPNLALAKENA